MTKFSGKLILSLIGLLLCTLSPVGAGGKANPGGQDKDLVWPPPPLTPRIRFVKEIRSAADVQVKKKRSFLDRLMGAADDDQQIRLTKPYGVAVGRDQRIYVADSAQSAIVVIDLNSNAISLWRGDNRIALSLPAGLAVDDYGRLFVTDAFAAKIVVFDSGGSPQYAFGEDLKRPAGIAIDSSKQKIFVVDVAANQVCVFDLQSLDLLTCFGEPCQSGREEPGCFSSPTNVALDSGGKVFVSDTFNRRIQVFDDQGTFQYTFGSVGMQPGRFVRPKGIALDREDHVYVLDAEFNNLQVLDSQGKPLMFLGSFGDKPGQFQLPTGIAIDSQNRIYVTEHGTNQGRLQIFQYLSQDNSSQQSDKGAERR